MNLDKSDLHYFIEECNSLIKQLENGVQQLAVPADSSEAVNAFFRSMHTLKGNARIVGSTTLEELCVAIEDVLEKFRQGRVTPDDRIIKLMSLSVDELKKLLNQLYSLKAAGSANPKILAALRFVSQKGNS
ncbi:Hpt domain-containing protein [Piscirickettsia litoralis]|uniref:Histidine phosphotransferase n=1 Tax=Piscirickettsia litoralis TaxID=1891921 RepID=A0ABX3A7E6_9GAMM|nr:Hpt domain-containing protein [Piscirickettsia litoralis]ODN42014.1 histidine phosphotransferase [Piscirickettsia litoralis]